MKPARKLHLYVLIMILVGAGALTLGGQSTAFALATVTICILNWLWFTSEKRRYLSDWLATLICGAAFLLTLFRLPTSDSPLGILFVNVPRAGEFLLIVQWALLFRRKTGRDYAFIFLTSFMLVVCAALLVPDIIFVTAFLTLLFVGQCSLSLLHVALEEERAGRPVEAAVANPAWRAGRSFLRRRAIATALVLAPIAVIFAVMPRGGGGMPLRPISLSPIGSLTALTGFSDTVTPGSVANVIESTGRVMEVTVTIHRVNAGKDYPLLLRGASFNWYGYDNGAWSWLTEGNLMFVSETGNVRDMYDDDFSKYLVEPGDRVNCDIWLEPLDSRVLFAPFAVEKVELFGPYRIRENRVADTLQTQYLRPSRLHYATVSRVAPLSRRQLPVTDGEYISAAVHYLYLPEDRISARVYDLSQQVANAGTDQSSLAKAGRIESYLRDGGKFQYSLRLTPPPKGAEPVDYFLFTSHTGFCEQYAGAMTVMLRCVGIPARLVTGFKGGTWNSIGGFFTVRQSDAHSWVEAYVPPYGWVTFDPTGPSQSQRQPAAGTQARVWDFTDYVRSAWVRYVVGYDRFRQVEMYRAAGSAIRQLRRRVADFASERGSFAGFDSVEAILPPVGIVLAVVVVGGGVTLGIILWTRRSRLRGGMPNTVRFYEAMLRFFRARGLIRSPDKTALEFAGQIVEKFPDCGPLVSEITDQFCLVRYGGRSLDHESDRRLTGLVSQLHQKVKNNNHRK